MEQNSDQTTAPAEGAAGTSTEAAEAPVRRRAPRRATTATVEAAPAEAPAEAPAAASAAAGDTAEAPAEPKKRVSRARKKADAPEAAEVEAAPAAAAEAAPEAEAPKKPTRLRAKQPAKKAADEAAPAENATTAESATASAGTAPAEAAEAPAEGDAPKKRNTRTRSRKPAAEAQAAEAEAAAAPAEAEAEPKNDTRNGRKRGGANGNDNGNGAANAKNSGAANGNAANGAAKNEASAKADDTAEGEQAEGQQQEKQGRGSGQGGQNAQGDGQTRSSRTRQRERKRRGQGEGDEPEITEDDVLLPIAGILDVLENYAFVRTSGYLPGTGDVYVSLGQVKKYGMRKGDAVVGAIRQPREGEGGGRQKYNAIVKVDTINSKPVDEQRGADKSTDEKPGRPDFGDLTPVHPAERLRLETDAAEFGTRVIDLFAPIGKGQRGLIIGARETGKSTALRQIAQAVAQNQPEAHLMLVLIDERPEEVTELQRTVNGEVIASTFDRPAEDHTTIAELAIERAKRLVELGHDVVLLIDSLTSLARAYNLAAPASVRVPAGSLDAAAIYPVKRLLSAARNIENGGSLTIVATASAQPESQLDEALIGELEGVSNMQLRLLGKAADRRVFPAIDLRASSTRNEALLTSEAEVKVLNELRRDVREAGRLKGLEQVLKRLGKTSSNVEFLAQTQKSK